MQANRPEFWIDVGGTFTDCFLRTPEGSLRRYKLLSSGATKGEVSEGSTRTSIVDSGRSRDPQRFWNGFELRLLDVSGDFVVSRSVAEFDHATGRLAFSEALSVDPQPGQAYELRSDDEAPVIAIRYLLGLRSEEPIPPCVVRLGTTRGTNALITRRGAKTAFVTTRGFGDVLRIGYQNRPRLFDLAIKKPPPLFAETIEIDERIAADGGVLLELDQDQAWRELEQLKARGVESLAICLLHAFAHPKHERRLAEIARDVGFQEVSVSHCVAPLIKIVSRGDTTVMDAYLNPVLRAYVARLRAALGEGRHGGSELKIMTSSGGLVAADKFVGKDSILSGPAGGVVGFSRVAEAAGFSRAIGFDMGGTSTDVARYDGRLEIEYETEKAGVRVVAPMMAIETVAAGGGSICGFDGVKLVVGPDSAGADPGPACYGRGGPLTVTDLNFYLGKIPPARFPFPLRRSAVEERLRTLIEEVERATGRKYDPIELCDGFLRVANANMVRPIRSISVAKGYDPREYVLVAFGGAAGQHACAVAAELGMTKVLLHPDAGLLSAYGIGLADVVRHRAKGLYQPYSEPAVQSLAALHEELAEEARREVLAEGIAPDRIEVRRALDLRYVGVAAVLTIAAPRGDSGRSYADEYAAQHQQLYGYVHAERPLEIVAARVEVVGRTQAEPAEPSPVVSRTPTARETIIAHFSAQPRSTTVHYREELRPGDMIAGPAIVCEDSSTTVIDPGWKGEVLSRGELLLTLQQESEPSQHLPSVPHSAFRIPTSDLSSPDPVLLEIFNNQFAGIAEQMGITLRNTSSSVNVKERLDFSCALFTPTGDLVVNAPHIPVHLGAMSETVKQILADNPDMRPGDVFVTNDPYRGGSHLPDVTVVTPVFEEEGRRQEAVGREERGEGREEEKERREDAAALPSSLLPPPSLLFFTASRAHHAEIGGIRPGSMPPFSKNLAEEGVLIRNFKLVAAGRLRTEELRELLLAGPYPTRAVRDNLADVAAQVAANNQGARDLQRLIERHSLPVVQAYMRHIQDAAETKMRRALRKYAETRGRGDAETGGRGDAERRGRGDAGTREGGEAGTREGGEAGTRGRGDAETRGRGVASQSLSSYSLATSSSSLATRHSPLATSFTDHLDDGSPIAVTITIEGDSARIDFSGTGPVMAGNLNANRAIVTAAVMYVLRCLIDEDIPLNQGVLKPVEIIMPECLLSPPAGERAEDCPAVVGGNVETSQRVVDVLLGALGIAAASQGTMNNTLFGDGTFGYYETICGGSGATADADGADAVHTHMTNTRLTDPEVIEKRYPVRVREFSIRRGSGGEGRQRGGDGIVRRLEFCRDLELSVLSQRRGPYPPFGLNGGAAGSLGENTLTRADGRVEPLGGLAQVAVQRGDVLTIQTPGGGGFGD